MSSYSLTTGNINDDIRRFRRVPGLFAIESLEDVHGLLCRWILFQVILVVRLEGSQKIGSKCTGLDYEDLDVVLCKLSRETLREAFESCQ